MLFTWSVCIPLISHAVRVYRHILYQSMPSTWPVCFNSYCLHGQNVSPYTASIYAVNMASMFQFILPTWSERIPCNAHVVRAYCHISTTWSGRIAIYRSRGQGVLPYIDHVVRAYCHITLTWSECLTIRRINSYCPHGQNVSPYGAPIYTVMVRVSHYIAPMWPECIPYNAHVVIVSHGMMHRLILPI